MVYIAPEDQDIETGDGVLRIAWTDRRQLRLEIAEMQAKLKALSTFIDTYITRAKPHYAPRTPQVKMILSDTSSDTSAGDATLGDKHGT